MRNFEHLLRCLTVALAAFAMVAGTATVAQAVPHSLTGNARFQIGGGLPIPITGAAPPNDRIVAVAGAIVHETAGADPKKMILPPSQLVNGPPNLPFTPNVNIGVFLANSAVFQVRTKIPIQFPKSTATFSVNGRTGAPVVSFCPGQVVTPVGNPGCLTPTLPTGPGAIPGIMIYSKTANQFGGPARGALQGSADVALNGGGNPPGAVTASFYFATPAATGAQGAPFGVVVNTVGMSANPSGMGKFNATANGKLTAILTPSTGVGTFNTPTSYGGPWTTGMLTLKQPSAVGMAETFTFTGSDMRVSGVGTISLVSGAISTRAYTGPNANRGWLNLNVGPAIVATPALPVPGLVGAFGLLAAAGAYALRRVRSS